MFFAPQILHVELRRVQLDHHLVALVADGHVIGRGLPEIGERFGSGFLVGLVRDKLSTALRALIPQ